MTRRHPFASPLALALVLALATAGCLGAGGDESDDCDDDNTGRVTVTNDDDVTLVVVINGAIYGTLAQNESESYDLPAGPYTLRGETAGGSAICDTINVNVTVCSRQRFTCDNESWVGD